MKGKEEILKNCSTSKNKITSIAIGGFDGMHLAHQALFSQLGSNGGIVVIETGYANLTPNRYREKYTNYPIFYYVLKDIKHLSGKQFIELLKKEYSSLKKIVVGYDFRFGANRECSLDTLKEFFDGEVVIIKRIKYENISVHARTIREFLNKGRLEEANKFLNRKYQISATKIKGQGLGKKQFVPTINLKCIDFLLPCQGVYATQTIVNLKKYKSVTFIGNRLTTDDRFSIETHIVEKFDEIFYSKIKIKFLKKIRDNTKFETYSALKKQILKDIDNINIYI